ncbi:hypothetical protein BOTBODRAFT_53686 [Botryobasidium botryosum FD-172 SS1]|uniref:RlpA-like protein double-psi beta-barrel domain-containing protein n=1 Tax=Botryobasidium botryosum (strain FD-172 SS1) TaxID=930990 RepID=A0A067MZY2_BOTB1|nr:hypothetical protein BOTBODRAFT_172677 [Botryobasidium botryosum FD-172 SS1]KDQ17091.1 hypothetical protein BOTBODRAFT_53686 [Botryobasidium botryosum FD-172 SS1]
MFSHLLALALLSLTSLVAAQIVKTGTLTSYGPQATNLYCGASCVNNDGWIAVTQANINTYPCGTVVRLWDPTRTDTVVVPICDVYVGGTADNIEANPHVLAVLGAPGAASIAGVEWDI